MKIKLALMVILLTVAGCDSGGTLVQTDDSDENSELAVTRQRWISLSADTYSFTVSRGCFCGFAGTFRVEVSENVVVKATSLNSGDSVPAEFLDTFRTIDQMFALIEEATAASPDRLDVTFSDRGFPELIILDPDFQMSDDELDLRISDLVILN